jgi:hypothetical protein
MHWKLTTPFIFSLVTNVTHQVMFCGLPMQQMHPINDLYQCDIFKTTLEKNMTLFF